MPIKPPSANIDTVSPDEVMRFHELAVLKLVDLKDRLRVRRVTRIDVETAVGKFINALPRPVREGIDILKCKEDITTEFTRFCAAFQSDPSLEVRQADIINLVARATEILVRHHAHTFINVPTAEELSPAIANRSPEIQNRYKMLITQRATELAVWFVSAFTSWMGLTHYCGKGIGWVTDTLQYPLPPELIFGAREGIAIGGAVVVSQYVQIFKARIEEVAHSEDRGIIDSTMAVIRRAFANIKGWPFALAGAGVLAFDVGTNVNGLATAVLQRHSIAGQLEEAGQDLERRKESLRVQMERAAAIPAQVQKEIGDIVWRESQGESETQRQGQGPVYKAKSFLYLETPGAQAELKARAAAGQDFPGRLEGSVKGSGLVDGKDLPKELEERIRPVLDAIAARLAQAEEAKKQLDPSNAIEFLQRDLDQIVQVLADATTLLNGLPVELQVHVSKYDEVARRIVELAQASGLYPNIKPDKLAQWQLPEIKVSKSKIKLGKIKYVGFEELGEVMERNLTPEQMLFFILLAMVAGYLASYLDLHTLTGTRAGYRQDRKEADKKKRTFVDYFESKITEFLAHVLNEGPFSTYFKPTTKLNPATVKEALDARIEELSELPRDRRWFRLLQKFLPVSVGDDWRGKTEVAQRHNARVAALKTILSSPLELGGLIRRLLPAIEKLDSESLGTVRGLNDSHIDNQNAGYQRREIQGIRNVITEIARQLAIVTTTYYDDVRGRLLSISSALAKLEPQVNPKNKEFFDQTNILYKEVKLRVEEYCAELINRDAQNISLNSDMGADELDRIERLCAQLEKRLNDLSLSNTCEPFVQAKERIARVRTEIQEINKEREVKREEAARLAREAQEREETRVKLAQLTAWFDVRQNFTNDTDRIRHLATFFGQGRITGSREQLEALEASFLEWINFASNQEEKLRSHAASKTGSTHDWWVAYGSKKALPEDMDLLRGYFQRQPKMPQG